MRVSFFERRNNEGETGLRNHRGKIGFSSILLWVCILSSLVSAYAFDGIANNQALKRPASSLRSRDFDSKSKTEVESSVESREKTAVIVGAGPGGLAAAIVLSNIEDRSSDVHHGETATNIFDRVIVLDEAPNISYDPSRSYFFNINGRGLKFIDAYDIQLGKRGSEVSCFKVHYVPSDPEEVFEGENPVVMMANAFARSFWIPRHDLLTQLAEEIHSQNKKNGDSSIIEVHRGVSCEYIEPTKDGAVKLVVGRKDAKDKEEIIITDLCVGADGMASKVRKSLEDGRFVSSNWSNASKSNKKFKPKKYVSPATGLRVKGFRINPNFAIPKGGTESDSKSEIPIEPDASYILKPTTKTTEDLLRISIFPQRDLTSCEGRPILFVTQPEHDLWNPQKIRTDDGCRSMKSFLKRAQPRYDWDKIVSDEELERFVSSKGTRFPPCQYVPSTYVSSNPSHNDSEEKFGGGVVLIGDALHSFPPDLGEGVNMAFADAMMLGKSLEEAFTIARDSPNVGPTSKISILSKALQFYDKKNGPEARAIVAMARCGSPFQYPQTKWFMKFRKFLWLSNFLLRTTLNKVTFGITPLPVISLKSDSDLSYSKVMKKANSLTVVLWSVLGFGLLSLVRSRIIV
mmetsp:Transcript_18773/g.43432  ORF Transcript_18773/g.43432 Transcript_18773/m.43432 type:complete len:629 (-) Transcript_18773:2259-4145(-)|eukprot:CAMPEP_0197179474 /NCGR_PEP_ID=MMETSP1423-20130617/4401_1 /TAXON_ID=476441 /ORGANISM="Pseudo-nitzschia heimii, Strain UNC1101" /LENGTH=628 /DNA_ID=CAMNT_0042629385 /DNA_START=188 /DNA_END=2074 /DNA_ORIENTATION=+